MSTNDKSSNDEQLNEESKNDQEVDSTINNENSSKKDPNKNNTNKKKIKGWQWALIILAGLIIIASVAFVVWANMNTYQPTERALANMEDTINLKVFEDRDYIHFVPDNEIESIGIIFYPGGLVEPQSYSTTLKPLAEAGYEIYICKMPLNLAIFDSNAAHTIINSRKEKNWVIIGHSLGGSMGAKYIHDQAKDVNSGLAGLIYWASYTTEGSDLSYVDVEVASIYGTLDMGIEGILENKVYNPGDTEYFVIEGGNHAQFGDYGPQEGDNEATITFEEQLEAIVKSTIISLKEMQLN